MGHHRHARLGADTFQGSSSLLGTHRPVFFAKTCGQVELDQNTGLLKVASPVSGHTLTVPDGSLGPQHRAPIRDPITGTVLSCSDGHAQVVTPCVKQPQVRAQEQLAATLVDTLHFDSAAGSGAMTCTSAQARAVFVVLLCRCTAEHSS